MTEIFDFPKSESITVADSGRLQISLFPMLVPDTLNCTNTRDIPWNLWLVIWLDFCSSGNPIIRHIIIHVKSQIRQLVCRGSKCYSLSSSGISLFDVMNTWLQPLTPQVFKVRPQEVWMSIPGTFTSKKHPLVLIQYQLFVPCRVIQCPSRDVNTHWPTVLDTMVLTKRPMSSAESLAATALRDFCSQKKQLKERRKKTPSRAQ